MVFILLINVQTIVDIFKFISRMNSKSCTTEFSGSVELSIFFFEPMACNELTNACVVKFVTSVVHISPGSILEFVMQEVTNEILRFLRGGRILMPL